MKKEGEQWMDGVGQREQALFYLLSEMLLCHH